MSLTTSGDFNAILSFTIASVALLASPGPATVALAASGANFGLRRSLKFYFGIVTGLVPPIMIVATGLLVAIQTIPHLSSVLFGISVAYILYLALRIATAAPLEESTQTASPGFPSGFFLGLTNIKAYAVFAALFGGFTMGGNEQSAVAIKVAICMGVIVIFDLLWLAMGSSLRHFFTNPVLNRVVNIALAVMMVTMVAWSVLAS